MFAENNNCFPSGLHFGEPAPYLYLVSCIASPPSSGSKNICGLVSTVLTKAICFPSGLNAGCDEFSLEVSCLGVELPSVFTIQSCVTYLYSSLLSPSGSMLVTVNTALLPSLLSEIPAGVFIFSMSVTFTRSLPF